MGLTRFLRRRHWDNERRRELEAHVEIETDANIARGMTEAEARAHAHRKLGNVTFVREEIYRMNTIGWLESIWQDLRYGARLLRRSPGFATVALLSLTLGIGANAAFFQLLDVVRLRSLPIERPGELVEVRFAPAKTGRTGSFFGTRPTISHPIWTYLRDRQTSLTDMFAFGSTTFDLSTGGESRPVQGLWVSGGYFDAQAAGLRPAA